jgi:protoporphyrinogen oxidase
MRIGIVGGGIAGLTAAFRLSQAGHQVAVFEAAPTLGGQAGTFPIERGREDGPRLEYFYHHIFQSDHAVIRLINELGLTPKLAWLSSQMGYFYGRTIYDFVTPLDLLRFRPLPFFARLALGVQSLWLQMYGDWRKLERVTVRDWVLRWGGKAIYDVVWGAMTHAKFGDYADQVSMAWLWGKIAVRRSLKGSGVAKETLGYLLGSFQGLTDALAERVRAAGGEVHTNAPVRRVLTMDGAVQALRIGPEGAVLDREFDAVILTVPSPLALNMVPEMPEPYAGLLRSVPYQGAEVLVLKVNRSLSRIYWMNVPQADIPFVAAIEQTNYVGPEHYGGARLLYLSNYLSPDDPRYSYTKEELLAYYTPYVQRINPAFDASWVQDSWLFKEPYGQPIIGTNYSQRIPDHRTPIAGLYLANTTQIYPEDRGINYSVRLGEVISEVVQGREARVSERW